MGNIVIISILIVAVLLALRGTFKHYKGEGGCCGGGTSTLKIKGNKLKKVDGIKVLKIEGMTCKHCKMRVENALNSLESVNAKVNLRKGEAIVKFSGSLKDEELKRALEEAGYHVQGILTK